jgi:uncharacterized surface protein with fasciclin (FAS1) repeats
MLLGCFALLLAACKKETVLQPSPPLPALPGILKVLDSMENFSLFRYALKKANLDTALSSRGIYTIFATDNPGMNAAGLSKDGIDRLTADSLYKLFSYPVAIGNYPDSVLAESANYVGVQSIRQEISFVPATGYRTYRQYLYIGIQGGKLYVNAQPANNGERALQAGNGWIYPVNRIFSAPIKSLYATIQSRPELSYYFAALRIIDSLYISVRAATSPFPKILDSNFLAAQGTDFQALNVLTASGRNLLSLPTVLAPVNDAFINAGMTNVDAIRNFCLKRPVADIKKSKYIGLDSVLKDHILFSPLDLYYNFIFSSQFLQNPGINNKIHNVSLYSRMLGTSFPSGVNAYLQFSVVGDQVSVIPSGNVSMTPAKLLNTGRDILTTNGIIHEVDRLMPPVP